ncbi:MAG: hypothetical protein QOE71_3524 [Pseudonocardiales bacterium]|jgi:hypothetical protein|nr:hypothetical protein [Pseudonocardiales bacterium]
MTDLQFTVLDLQPEPFAAAPLLTARLRVEEGTGAVVHALALRVQVRIEPQRRAYSDDEADGLLDLFGGRARWSETVRPFLWTHCVTLVQGFAGSTEVDVPLPCTYDFEVSASKYLHALQDGEVPLVLLFSGTVFTRGETGFAVQQVPWDSEAGYRMPVAVWRRTMDEHFPNSAWIRLGRDQFDALHRFRTDHATIGWDDTVALLLDRAAAEILP